MDELATIQDYSLIDNFLQTSLNSYKRQLFGDYDDNTGYFEEVEPEKEVYEEQAQEEQPSTQEDRYQSQQSSEEDFFGMLFNDNDIDSYIPRASGIGGGGNVGGSNSGFQSYGSYEEGKAALINQLKLYQTGRTRNPVSPNSTLLQAMSVYAPAADKNNPVGYANFIAKQLGISPNTPISQIDTEKWAAAIEKMEGNKVGNNPGNLRRQAGGYSRVARTSQEQYVGLNDPALDELILPLNGYNTIRGLDSGEPVIIKDENGYVNILKGPTDKIRAKGRVFEKRIKRRS